MWSKLKSFYFFHKTFTEINNIKTKKLNVGNKILKTKYNEYDINDLPNPYFQDLKLMSEVETNIICEQIRQKLLSNWNKKQPLGGGRKSDEQIVKDFKNLIEFDDKKTLITDKDGKRDVLKFFGKMTSGINQYFPEMLDTPISLGKKSISVMDVIKTKETFTKFFNSVVIRDRMYSFTMWYKAGTIPQETLDLIDPKILIPLTTGFKIPFFYKKDNVYYKLNKSTIRYEICGEKEYDSNSRIFPQITQSFRLGGGSQPVSNFSAGIAKCLVKIGFQYSLTKNLIEHDTFIFLDTSTGWGGRLVGLLSSYTYIRKQYFDKTGKELRVVYLTTDPNAEINNTYKDIIDDWFSVIEPDSNGKFFRMFKSLYGSETIEFLQYSKDILNKLKVSGCNIGLTSPPYFNREQYSTDKGQSWVKYNGYLDWSTGFLKETISNISELMVNNGIFMMNIADIKIGGKIIPLEDDANKYGEIFNMKNIGKYKMLLSTMTGNNKNKETGGEPKNSVELVDGFKKYEPIFFFQKK